METQRGRHEVPFEKEASRFWDTFSVRLANRTKVWKNVCKQKPTTHGGEMRRSTGAKDVPWIKNWVENVHSVSSSGATVGQWSRQALDRIQEWEISMVRSLVSLQKKEDETWVGH